MLLNVLAGQLTASPRLHLSGLLEVNGKPSSNKAYKFAYVRQEDLFFSQLMVRETLSLAAELQLPEISSVEARDEYVKNLLFKLGLVRLDYFFFFFFVLLFDNYTMKILEESFDGSLLRGHVESEGERVSSTLGFCKYPKYPKSTENEMSHGQQQ
ncbi:hypothetical protein L484_011571 [Morus notabilis]|uniref:Uncharacterized protein n=1 Tax=Morus notabilis TaxID=981085 RepID=W9RKU3_9ROSA|nr:hypothetical protein L484_011571 [Morus notabilis]